MAKKTAKKTLVTERRPLQMSMEAPTNGIKLTINHTLGGVAGTLIITSEGVKVLRANAKKEPANEMSWNTLAKMQAIQEEF